MQPVPPLFGLDDPAVTPSDIESTGDGAPNGSALGEKIIDVDAQVQGEWTEEEEKAVRRKLDLKIVPIVTVLFLLCFLDRYVKFESRAWYPITSLIPTHYLL